jgi:AhpD family alkylhydroperoxidase
MSFTMVPVELLPEPFRTKVEGVQALGGDPSFFQFAANARPVVDFYWGDFYGSLFFNGTVPIRVKELVRLRLAAHSGCGFCQVGDAESARTHGVTNEEIEAVMAFELDRFGAAERAALMIADLTAATQPPKPADPSLLAELRTHFSDAELVELFTVVGVLNGMGRMLVATGFVPATCEVPSPE